MTARPLAGRIALITGASRGIGRATAKGFAMAGATVVAVARTEGALTELDDELQLLGLPPLVLAPLDLAEGERIDQMAGLIARRFGRLDILVAAAAQLGGLGPVTHFDPPAIQRLVALNFTAQWRLLRAADPLLRRSDAGRAIFLTSTAARLSPAYWGPYAATKAALEALIRTYAAETETTTAIRANLLDPGAVRTRLRAEAFPGEDPATLPDPETLLPTLLRLATPECSETGQIVSPAV